MGQAGRHDGIRRGCWILGALGTLKLVDSGVLGTLDASREIALLVALLYLVMG